MALSGSRHIGAAGFQEELLPAVLRALDGGMVVVGKSRGFCGAVTTPFSFANCEWEIDELNEYVERIRLVSGQIDAEALTIALLKGKIEAS